MAELRVFEDFEEVPFETSQDVRTGEIAVEDDLSAMRGVYIGLAMVIPFYLVVGVIWWIW